MIQIDKHHSKVSKWQLKQVKLNFEKDKTISKRQMQNQVTIYKVINWADY